MTQHRFIRKASAYNALGQIHPRYAGVTEGGNIFLASERRNIRFYRTEAQALEARIQVEANLEAECDLNIARVSQELSEALRTNTSKQGISLLRMSLLSANSKRESRQKNQVSLKMLLASLPCSA
jgi:hypothetical protein